jgi:hypothetical protein
MPNNKDVIEDTEQIIEDTEEIQKDTDEIIDKTSSIDKKIWFLISLWIVDKIMILLMLLLIN